MTALRVGDLSRQGKPPEERETGVSGVCADSLSKHATPAALTWVRFCLGSGESGTEPPGRVSEAAQTAR